MPGVILARVECDYKRPATSGETLDIRLTVAEIGRSSFRYEYEIVDGEGRTIVCREDGAGDVRLTRQENPCRSPTEIRALLAIHTGAPTGAELRRLRSRRSRS